MRDQQDRVAEVGIFIGYPHFLGKGYGTDRCHEGVDPILHRYVQGELALAEALRQPYAFPSRTPEHFQPARSTTQVVDLGHSRLPTVKTAEGLSEQTAAGTRFGNARFGNARLVRNVLE
ncbi:MAG: hypothetical protein IMW85_01195, partial [Thermicanus sp.]|nr:hypothetical protein [Thermicanus sp.]